MACGIRNKTYPATVERQNRKANKAMHAELAAVPNPLHHVTRAYRVIAVVSDITLIGRLMKKTMRYQVVFQFPETFFETHSDLVAFEQKLIASMPKTCDVDGHDISSGTINFFVYTDSPLAAHKHFRQYLGTNKVEKHLRVSYREVDGEAFTNLWPFRDPRPFDIIYPDGVDPFSAASKRSIPKRSPPGVSKFETPAASEWPSR